MSVYHFSKLLALRAGKAFPGQDLTSAPIQSQVVEIFARGLLNEYVRRKLVIKDCATLDAAVKLAAEEEMIQKRLAAFNVRPQAGPPAIQPTQLRSEMPMEVDFISSESDNRQLPPDYYSPETYIPAGNDLTPEETYESQYAPNQATNADISAFHTTAHHVDDSCLQEPFQALPYVPQETYQLDPSVPSQYEEDPSVFAAYGNSNNRCFICNSNRHLCRECPACPRHFAPSIPGNTPRYSSPRYSTQQPRYSRYPQPKKYCKNP